MLLSIKERYSCSLVKYAGWRTSPKIVKGFKWFTIFARKLHHRYLMKSYTSCMVTLLVSDVQ